MLALLHKRNYALLWWGQLISLLGNWALFAALPFYVYEVTGSVLATGVMFIVQVVPPLLFGSVAGVFVDRWDRRWTMIGANLLRGGLLLLLLTVRSEEWIWLVYVVGFFESTVGQFFGPANNALLPHLVGEESLLTANSLDAFGENGARILGPGIGGLLLGTFGLSAVVLLDVFSYVVAAFMIYLIVVPDSAKPQRSSQEDNADRDGQAKWSSVWRQWVEGLRLVAGKPALVRMFMVFGIAILADGILTVLLVAFLKEVMMLGAVEFGWVLTTRGLGGLLGGLVIGQIGERFRPVHLIAFGLLGTGLLFLIMVHIALLWVVLALVIVIGVPVMAWLISSQTWLQTHSPDAYRGRVFGAFGTTSALMSLIGMSFASFAGDALGIVPTLDVSALLYLLSGVVAWVLLREVGQLAEPVADQSPAD